MPRGSAKKHSPRLLKGAAIETLPLDAIHCLYIIFAIQGSIDSLDRASHETDSCKDPLESTGGCFRKRYRKRYSQRDHLFTSIMIPLAVLLTDLRGTPGTVRARTSGHL